MMTDGHALQAVITTGDPPAAWSDYVEAHPDAAWYHAPGWAEVVRRAYGLRSAFVVLHQGDAVAGGATFVQCPRFPFGRKLIAGAFLASGGMLLNAGIDRVAAEAAVVAALRRAGIARTELREREAGATAGAGDLVVMVLGLSGGVDLLWNGLGTKVRNHIRKAEKSGVTTTQGAPAMDDFCRVFARHQQALGTPTHARAFFPAVAAVFGAQVDVFVGTVKGETAGGVIAFHYRDTVVALNAASLHAYNSLCVNYLVYWKAMAWAAARGAKNFDFGRSIFGSGTFDFKKQWGAVPVRLRYYDLARGPVAAPIESDKLKTAAKIWATLPAGLANVLGPRLRPYLA